MIRAIRKYLKTRSESKEEKEQKQSTCKHHFVKVPVEMQLQSQLSITDAIVGGWKTVSIKTEVLLCTKCDKELSPEIE